MEELAENDALRCLLYVACFDAKGWFVGPRNRSETVQRECKDANWRKAMQALVDATKFHGKWDALVEPFPDLVETLEVVKPGAALPVESEAFFKAMCGMTKGTVSMLFAASYGKFRKVMTSTCNLVMLRISGKYQLHGCFWPDCPINVAN